MNVPVWAWAATIIGLLAVLAVDLFLVDHHPHEIRVREAARWVVFYITLAVVFGVVLFFAVGARYAGEFLAGYVTEYSLSADNLFVFLILMTTFAVPAIHQHKVLLFGILAALVLRGMFIAVGAVVIARFQAVFFLFGAFLLYTAWKLAFGRPDGEEQYRENLVLRLARRVLPVTADYVGSRAFVRVGGKRFVTPLLIVMIAIGTTDLLFALDSIPAIFGLTKEPFLVFTANAFALLGLRQLFFLLGGLLNRLVYLNRGLAIILGFIGVKLVLEALHALEAEWAPQIGIMTSLIVIVVVLSLTTWFSLAKVRRDPSAARAMPVAAGAAPGARSRPPSRPGRRPAAKPRCQAPRGGSAGGAVGQLTPVVCAIGPATSRPSW